MRDWVCVQGSELCSDLLSSAVSPFQENGLQGIAALENGLETKQTPQVWLPRHPCLSEFLLRVLDFSELAALRSPLKQGACLLWKAGIMSNESLTF